MSFSSKNLTSDKVSLIYEFNQDSPLFARRAKDELDNDNFSEAIQILEKGLEIFPDYPSAYFVYALALAQTGEIEKAKVEAQNGSDLIQSEKTLEYYLREIDKIARTFADVKDSKRTAFSGEENTDKSVDEDLDKLAEEISKAKIPSLDDESLPEEIGEKVGNLDNNDKRIVSETLAKIYSSQGNIKEAIATYEKLAENNPGKADYFNEKIKELKGETDKDNS